MKHLFALAAIAAISLIAGCATQTISATSPAPIIAQNKTIASDFTATAGNLNCAVAIGILPATDPAVGCVNSALAAFNLPAVSCVNGVPTVAAASTTSPAASFTATNAGLVSGGSIAYIKLAQAQAVQPVTVSAACKQLLGQLQVDGLAATANPLGTVETILGLPQIK
jgi:hypothetical protein